MNNVAILPSLGAPEPGGSVQFSHANHLLMYNVCIQQTASSWRHRINAFSLSSRPSASQAGMRAHTWAGC